MNYLLNKILFFTLATYLVSGLFFWLTPLYASELILSGSFSTLGINQTLQIDVYLKPEGESINAVGATLEFPSQFLEFQGVRDNGSIINFWVEQPYLSTDNSVSFAGITPGGFNAEQGLVTSLFFKTKAEGSFVVKLKDAEVLRNDGVGGVVVVDDVSLPLAISADVLDSGVIIASDINSPEPFTVHLVRDPSLFTNKWFIVFSTVDKDSGVHHYEVAERLGALVKVVANDQRLHWREATSPYVLLDQTLKSGVYVRAVDRAGNERAGTLPPQVALAWYENYRFYGILCIVIIALIIIKKLWRGIVKK